MNESVTATDMPGMSSLVDLCRLVNGSSNAASVLRGWQAVMQVTFSDEPPCFLQVSSTGVDLRTGTHIKPTVELEGTGSDLATGFGGGVDLTQLLARGRMTSKGRYRDVIEFGRLASAARRARRAEGGS
jgi:hypothetical protein